ncbi:MAG: metal ABC transporter substrate-binding protein, partial [Limisphaerales bacterium]
HLVLAPFVKLIDVPTGPVDRSMGDVHPTGNPHFWLDPRNGKIIAQRVAGVFSELDPNNASLYEKNRMAFESKIDSKWAEWEKKLEPLRGAKLITYHKSYEYLAAAFGLAVVAQLEPKPGIEPSATHIAHLVLQARGAGVKWVVIEPYRPRKSAEQVADAIGARMLVLPDKTGSIPEAKDYFALFDTIVSRLSETNK